jgi:hypothetical protein
MTAATWLIFNWITDKSRWPVSSTGRCIIQRLAVSITDQWLPFVMSRGSSPDGASQLLPSTEAVKALNSLESLVNSKHYQELRSSVEHAVKLATDPSNSLHNASYILGVLATDLFQHKYLLVLKVSVMICDASCCLAETYKLWMTDSLSTIHCLLCPLSITFWMICFQGEATEFTFSFIFVSFPQFPLLYQHIKWSHYFALSLLIAETIHCIISTGYPWWWL